MLLYNIFWLIGLLIGLPPAVVLVLCSEKRRKTILHRLGLTPLPCGPAARRMRPASRRPIWIHALSVGEVLSAEALTRAIRSRFPQRDLYFSVSTHTGYKVARERLGRQVKVLFFFPYDVYFSVRRCVRAVNPALMIIVETDVWPNFMARMKQAAIPVFMINARLSDSSLKNYRRLLPFSRRLFSAFTVICTQSGRDAEAFRQLGVPAGRIVTTGNIKFDTPDTSLSAGERERLRRSLGIGSLKRIVIAGSTHDGEELIFRSVFSRLKTRFPDLVLIVVPRDPDRAGQVVRLFAAAGITAARSSRIAANGAPPTGDVRVVDTIGILGRLYALADIAFVGGSLVAAGGHNPLEAAVFGRPILFGPDMSDFRQIAQMLTTAGGAVRVDDARGLYRTVGDLLTQADTAEEMGRQARRVFFAHRGALEKTLSVIAQKAAL